KRPRAELLGKNIRDVAAPDDRELNYEQFRDMVARGSGDTRGVRLQASDGSIVTMEISRTVLDVDGERLVLSIARDMTEQLRTQAQLMVSDRMASVGMLAAGVA